MMIGSRLMKRENGGIVLEAALLLPLFMAFIVSLIMFIQISLAEMALQSAVSETTKSIAAQLYPLKLVLQEAKSKYDQSHAAGVINSAVEHVQTARSKVIGAEGFIDEYASYIPDPVLEILKWEKEKREQGEDVLKSEYDSFLETQINPRINAAFTPIVYSYSDSSYIKRDNLQVTSVILPDLLTGGETYFGVEAQLAFKLRLPFISRTLNLKKKAYERAWLGA
jgi:hypothetical protein